jgi:hypothetical protein
MRWKAGSSPEEETMDPKAILDQQFTVAAYAVTWIIQLSYLAFLGLKWRNEKRAEKLRERNPRS